MICGKCYKNIDKLPFSARQLCPECEEELEAQEILQEQNSNYVRDVGGSMFK